MNKKFYMDPSFEIEMFKTQSVLTTTSENPDTGVDPWDVQTLDDQEF